MGGFHDPYFRESGQFSAVVDFAKRLTNSFRIESGGGRLGLITYGSSAHVSFELNSFPDAERLRSAIGETSAPDVGGNLEEALKMSEEFFFAQPTSSAAPSTLVVVTAGKSTGGSEKVGERLRKLGVEIFCVGVGGGVEKKEINLVASRPLGGHAFTANFGELDALSSALGEKICRGKFCFGHFVEFLPASGPRESYQLILIQRDD